MPIEVRKVADDLYLAKLTLPDVPNVKDAWSTTEPIHGRQLTNELIRRGCHSTDVGDAMNEVDPDWIQHLGST
jgi:hypothetical protein